MKTEVFKHLNHKLDMNGKGVGCVVDFWMWLVDLFFYLFV